jgi:hypothetical protein
MRALLLFVIGLVFGGAFGFLASGTMEMSSHHGPNDADHDMADAHDHASHADKAHDHSALTSWPTDVAVPTLSLSVTDDGPTSRNLHIMAKGYEWTPEQVNGAMTTGGHAHVYINGLKVARAYGPWLHLEGFPTDGPVTVRVTFNANDHSGWAVDGVPLAIETVIE